MAARELLKYQGIERIDLVDLDEEMIRLFRDKPLLAQFSDRALSHPKLRIHIQDAGKFLEQSPEFWDLIVLDLPDPNNFSLARLYTKSFYKLVSQHLNAHGIVVTQATSPYYAAEAFWCVVSTFAETALGPRETAAFTSIPITCTCHRSATGDSSWPAGQLWKPRICAFPQDCP